MWCRQVPLLIVLAIQASANSGDFPDYPVRRVQDYMVAATGAGLTVAVQPVADVKSQKMYFKLNLASKGFIPVFIVIENASQDQSFLIRQENVSYRTLAKADDQLSMPRAGSPGGNALITTGVTIAALEVPAAIATLGAVNLAPVAETFFALGSTLTANSTEVSQNLLTRNLQTKTLSPHASAHGFVFLKVPKGPAGQKTQLRIPVTKLGSDEVLNFDLVF